jgi:1,4-alpha-glucan branching enzyme
VQAAIPDPTDAQTFERSKLDWRELDAPGHREWLALYRTLLAVRARHIAPRLAAMQPGGRYAVLDGRGVAVDWVLGDGSRLHLAVNWSETALDAGPPAGEVIYASHPDAGPGQLVAHGVVVALEEPRG